MSLSLEESVHIFGGELAAQENGLSISPDGYMDGGEEEEFLICKTASGGELIQIRYQYRCFHDEYTNPLWAVRYYGKGIKAAFAAYRHDFDSDMEYVRGWDDIELIDEFRGIYVCCDRFDGGIIFTWSGDVQ